MSWNKAIHTTILGAFRPIRGRFVLRTFLTLKRFKSNKFYMCKISSIASSQLAHQWATNGSPAIRYWNGESLTGRWWPDNACSLGEF